MHIGDAKDKSHYQFVGEGPQFPAVQPNTEGYFDHISPNDRAFSSTVMYATVRRVLDIWTDYFGHEIEWFFSKQFPKLKLLELIPRVKVGDS